MYGLFPHLLRHVIPPLGSCFREVPGVFHVSPVDKSDHTAISGDLGGVTLSFSLSKILVFHSHAATLWHTNHRV